MPERAPSARPVPPPARRLQRGQVLVLALALLGAGLAGALVMYNVGQATAERAQLQDAADAAAWSGGLWVARQLNFMAYTNRAMVANHVAAGHLVSYVSWLDYVRDSVDRVAFLTAWIPGVSAATSTARKVVSASYGVTKHLASMALLAVDGLNRLYLMAQHASRLTLQPFTLRSLMRGIARRHDPAIEVNRPAELARLAKEGPEGAALSAALAAEGARLAGFVRRYGPADDGGRIAALSWASLDRSRRWIEGERGWKVKVPFVVRVRKVGRTRQGGADLMDWRASDELQVSWWRWDKCFKGWSGWSTVARGSASARGLHPAYAGVPGYHALRDGPGDRRLWVSALASRPPSGRLQTGALVPGAAPAPLRALARAQVYHRRPDRALFALPGKGEHANLFNPFWEVRLAR